MAIRISQDYSQENKINNESEDINKKFLGSVDREDANTTTRTNIQNDIHNAYLNCVKTNRTMAAAYFKAALGAVYSEIYKKSMSWKNLQDDIDLQINLKKILNNCSYVKVHDILKYYSDEAEKDMIKDDDLINLTAMFFATLHNLIKDEIGSE